MKEIEAKYRVESISQAEKTLQTAGAEYLGKFLQTDSFYDKPGGELRKAGCGLRIRGLEVIDRPGDRQADDRPAVTFKGPVQALSNVKIRREIETKMDSALAMEEIFRNAAGLEKVVTIQKRRISYRLEDCQIELDELPLLGFFIEIEGPEDKIENVRVQLGIETDHINDSYLHMLLEKCQEVGISETNLTFEILT